MAKNYNDLFFIRNSTSISMTILKWFADVAIFADVVDVTVVAVGVAVEDHGSERDNYNAEAAIVTDDCKSFVVVTAIALVVDAVLVDEAAVVVPHCELVVVLGFDAAATYVVDVLDSSAVFALYLVIVAVLNPLGGIEIHVDVVFLVLRVFQAVLFFFLSGFSFTTIHELQGCSEKGRAFL